jgi:cyclic pyranopterin phosphate synthase
MPEKIDTEDYHDVIKYEDILSIVKASQKLGIKKVRYTGGEPLIYKNIEKLIYETSKINGIEDISITTNGMLLCDMAKELKNSGLKRVNISLDSLNEKKFRNITGGGNLKKVLSAVDICVKLGFTPVKLNTVIIRGINDDEIRDIAYLTKDVPVDVRFIELMPIGEGIKYFQSGFMNSEETMDKIPGLIPVKSERSSTAAIYKLQNSLGTIGFISPLSSKFCRDCNRIRLTSDGKIKPCLHSETEINLMEYIKDEALLELELKKAIYNKQSGHNLVRDGRSLSKRAMYEIGG